MHRSNPLYRVAPDNAKHLAHVSKINSREGQKASLNTGQGEQSCQHIHRARRSVVLIRLTSAQGVVANKLLERVEAEQMTWLQARCSRVPVQTIPDELAKVSCVGVLHHAEVIAT